AHAGTVTVENKNISVNKCVIKLHNKAADTSDAATSGGPASVVLGIGKVGATQTREIPNAIYEEIVLECEMSDNQGFSDENPKTMAFPKHRPICNSENFNDPIGTMKTLHITKKSPAISITVEKPLHNSKVMKNNFSCKINNLSELN
ncbi:MAG: hypothetical protein ACTHJ4_01030, partial [Candidatus Nucleicultricaceae bacterium]